MLTGALAPWVSPTIQVMCNTMRNVASEDARELNAGTIETLQATNEAGLRKTLDRKVSEQRRAYVCYACVVYFNAGGILIDVRCFYTSSTTLPNLHLHYG